MGDLVLKNNFEKKKKEKKKKKLTIPVPIPELIFILIQLSEMNGAGRVKKQFCYVHFVSSELENSKSFSKFTIISYS